MVSQAVRFGLLQLYYRGRSWDELEPNDFYDYFCLLQIIKSEE